MIARNNLITLESIFLEKPRKYDCMVNFLVNKSYLKLKCVIKGNINAYTRKTYRISDFIS